MSLSINKRISRIAIALPVVVGRLKRCAYIFDNPDAVLPGPEATVENSIAKIELEVGAVPDALAQFWRRIGSVDLRGTHPTWNGCEYPDPLVVEPASTAVIELEDFLDDRDERLRHGFPYVIPVSPDSFHKANVSGGMWYNVDCPATSDDPFVNDERHKLPFLDYLELALKSGGFLGLDRCPSHSWPTQELSFDVLTIE